MGRIAAFVAIAVASLGMAQQPNQPRFDVVSVKPSAERRSGQIQPQRGGYWSVQAMPLTTLIGYAFQMSFDRIEGFPNGMRSKLYDIEARMPRTTTDAQLRLMLQAMLSDRFQMRWHTEMRPTDVWILSAVAPGPGLHPAAGNCLETGEVAPPDSSKHACGVVRIVKVSGAGLEIAGYSVTMADVAEFFAMTAIHPVVDETGSKALYDFDVLLASPAPVQGESAAERNFDAEKAQQEAIRKQLGLDLNFFKTVKRSEPVLVIDHLAPASAN